MQHIIESQQFDRRRINDLFSIADTIAHEKPTSSLQGKIMASLFYEPSTRTRFSFESAMIRLGGSVLTTENAREFSSTMKGETLEDSIRVISTYADLIVLRHFKRGASKQAAAVSSVPIINAGDGIGQHPTQALLDLYTIEKEYGRIDGISIAMIGDLKHGRTIRSLTYLLGKYDINTIYFVSPSGLRIGADIKAYLDEHHIQYHETEDMQEVISRADVIYQTRIQKERFADVKTYQQYKGCYQINLSTTRAMKQDAILMHPLPRVDEILPEVDNTPQAVYFKQAAYGLTIRMALLSLLFSVESHCVKKHDTLQV